MISVIPYGHNNSKLNSNLFWYQHLKHECAIGYFKFQMKPKQNIKLT